MKVLRVGGAALQDSVCMLEVISLFMRLRDGSHVFAFLMLFLCVCLHTMWSVRACSCSESYPFMYGLSKNMCVVPMIPVCI